MDYDRREFLRLGGTVAAGAIAVSLLPGAASGLLPGKVVDRSGAGPYGPLGAPDDLGLRLPAGFSGRIVAHGDEVVDGTDYAWHVFPDGGAAFPTRDRGWIYVSNSEHPGVGEGGASALAVRPVEVRSSTRTACSAGPRRTARAGRRPGRPGFRARSTPRAGCGSAIPQGSGPASARSTPSACSSTRPRPFDPVGKRAYLTEDEPDGRFYRFTPAAGPISTRAGSRSRPSTSGAR